MTNPDDHGPYLPTPEEIEAGKEELFTAHVELMRGGMSNFDARAELNKRLVREQRERLAQAKREIGE